MRGGEAVGRRAGEELKWLGCERAGEEVRWLGGEVDLGCNLNDTQKIDNAYLTLSEVTHIVTSTHP